MKTKVLPSFRLEELARNHYHRNFNSLGHNAKTKIRNMFMYELLMANKEVTITATY